MELILVPVKECCVRQGSDNTVLRVVYYGLHRESIHSSKVTSGR